MRVWQPNPLAIIIVSLVVFLVVTSVEVEQDNLLKQRVKVEDVHKIDYEIRRRRVLVKVLYNL